MAEPSANGVHGGCAGAKHSEEGIPVVDLGVLGNGDADQRSQAIRHLGRACVEWGFFMVVINHGVPEALREAAMDACQELFSLPTEDKAEHMDGSPMDPVRVGTGFVNSTVDGAKLPRDYVKMFVHPDFHCPSKPANLRGIAAEYAARTRRLMLELTAAISESLGLPGDRIAEALNLASGLQILVGNLYPPFAGPGGGPEDDNGPGPIGLPAHSDHGLLTLLFQNGVDGLQVHHDGRWLLAKPIPGSFFVIAGDQLEASASVRCTIMAPPSPHRSEACSEDGIPVVDMAVLVNGDADQRAQAIRHLGRACQEWGIFMVINHGVPEALQGAAMDACKELLLSLPAEDKAEYMNGSPMDPVRVGTGFVNSAVDGARYWRDYLKMFVHPDFHCPSKPANLRDIAKEYAACTRGLMLELVAAISESLGLDGGRIAEALNLESCLQTLVANHYPPYDGPDDEGTPIGLPAHSDYGLLALLFQNGVDGLQVHRGGRWLLARPLPGSFFVIAGDQLEIVSNGRYKAALHRAWVGRERRMSVLALIAPSMDAVVESVPELAGEGPEGLEFRGVRFRDYMESHQSSRLVGKTALDVVRVQR